MPNSNEYATSKLYSGARRMARRSYKRQQFGRASQTCHFCGLEGEDLLILEIPLVRSPSGILQKALVCNQCSRQWDGRR